jgi:hypothetical protein
MPFTLQAAETLDSIANCRRVTGTGNLDDLVTACSTIGMTRVGNVITYAPGSTICLGINGTLTEDRPGVRQVLIRSGGHICFSYGASDVNVLGKKETSGAYSSRVDIVYESTAFAVGGDVFDNSPPIRNFAGQGTTRFVCGSLSYNQSARADLDLFNSVTLAEIDNFTFFMATLGGAYSHVWKSSGKITTTDNSAFLLSPRPMEGPASTTTVTPFFTDVGFRWLVPVAATELRVERPLYTGVDQYNGAASAITNVIDSNTTYMQWCEPAYSGAIGIKKIFRTLKSTFTNALGATISSPTPKLISVLGGSITSTNFVAKLASVEVLQSTRASGVTHTIAGTGWTNEANYSFYNVGYGYRSNYKNIDLKAVHQGPLGIPWSSTSDKSDGAVTAYASVDTAPFSFSTSGNGTLTVSTPTTFDALSSYLEKLAYDAANTAFWIAIDHNATVVTNRVLSTGLIAVVANATISAGTASTAITATSAIPATMTVGGAYTFIGGDLAVSTAVPTFTGGTLNIGAAATYGFATGAGTTTVSMTPTAPGTYPLNGPHSATLDLRNTSAHAIAVQLPTATAYTTANNTGGVITVTNPATTLQILRPNIINGSNFVIRNNTTATEVASGTTSGGTGINVTLTSGTHYSAGDVLELKIGYCVGVSARLVVTEQATAPAITAINSAPTAQVVNDVYASLAINGSTRTEFSADYVNDDVDIVLAADFYGQNFMAWWVYNESTLDGLRNFVGLYTLIDEGNIRNNTAVGITLFDNTTATNIKQIDNARIFRSDGGYPVKQPSTGGGSIDINWRNAVQTISVGSAVLPSDVTAISNAVWAIPMGSGHTAKQAVDVLTSVTAGKVSGGPGAPVFRSIDDTRNVVVGVADAAGNRTTSTITAV